MSPAVMEPMFSCAGGGLRLLGRGTEEVRGELAEDVLQVRQVRVALGEEEIPASREEADVCNRCSADILFRHDMILFFFSHRTNDLTKQLEKVGPFECDELEKHCRVMICSRVCH